jgi:beta-mannosidase
MFGRGDERHTKEGDAHNWFVWHDGEPFENYEEKVPRFMSEFGFQSYPALKTIQKFALPSEQNLDSDVMKAHQKHSRGNEIIKTYMQKQFGNLPANFAEFIEWSQLLQLRGIKKGIMAHLNARPRCTGSLIWQLNDCWPGVSWSMIDYYGNKKKLYYGVKEAFKE